MNTLLTRSGCLMALCTLAWPLAAQLQVVYPALEQFAYTKAVPATDGGHWIIGKEASFSDCRVTRCDAAGNATVSFILDSQSEEWSFHPSGIGMPGGGVLIVSPEMRQTGDPDMQGVVVRMIELDAEAGVVWQKKFYREANMGTQVYGNPVAFDRDALGNVFIGISAGLYGELLCVNDGQLVWWTNTMGISGNASVLADGEGGCFLANTGIVHYDQAGDILWERRFFFLESNVGYLAAVTRAGGSGLRCWAMVAENGSSALASVEVSTAGEVQGASLYGPFGGSGTEINGFELSDGHTVIVGSTGGGIIQNTGSFLTIDANGDVTGSATSLVGWHQVQRLGDRILLSTLKGYYDPDFEEPQYASVIWDAQADMSAYCSVNTTTADRGALALSNIEITAFDNPTTPEHPAVTSTVVDFLLTPMALPVPESFCTQLAPLLSTGVHEVDAAGSLVLAPSLVPAGTPVAVWPAVTGTVDVVAPSGALVRRIPVRQGERQEVGTEGLARGLYNLRLRDAAGRAASAGRLVIE